MQKPRSENSYEVKLVLFNGSNSESQTKTIYQQWAGDSKNNDKVACSPTVEMWAAFVDHFRESAQIMIATEAAAEGINLQF